MKAEANLKALGVEVENTEMDDSVSVDLELVTGASQLAAQKLAVVALEVLQTKLTLKRLRPSLKRPRPSLTTTSSVASRVWSWCFGPVLLAVFFSDDRILSLATTLVAEN